MQLRVAAWTLLRAHDRQDGIPRGSYRMTVPFTWRGGKARVFITPGPTFVREKPDGEVVVDSTGAVKKVLVFICRVAGRSERRVLHRHKHDTILSFPRLPHNHTDFTAVVCVDSARQYGSVVARK